MIRNARGVLAVLLVAGLLSGCASNPIDRNDKLESMNRAFYTVNDVIDRHFAIPVAKGYKYVTPKFVRIGITNFFANLNYINVIFHDILQGKGHQAVLDLARIVVNSSLGWGGIMDPATSIGLKKHHEDFGQTLAVWGVAQGPYLVLPFQGPETTRNLPNIASAMFTNPLYHANILISGPVGFLNAISNRANLLEATKLRDEAALDPYTFTREAFLQKELVEIFDGHPPAKFMDEGAPVGKEGEEAGGVLRVF